MNGKLWKGVAAAVIIGILAQGAMTWKNLDVLTNEVQHVKDQVADLRCEIANLTKRFFAGCYAPTVERD